MAQSLRPRLVCTTCWSFGRDRVLFNNAIDELTRHELDVVDAWTDPDLNRTEFTAVGPNRNHIPAWEDLAKMILPAIDLNRHAGTHPRIGALDLARFSPLDDDATEYGFGVTFGEFFSELFEVPLYYDGPEAEAGSEIRILELRKAGFGGLGKVAMHSDHGPFEPHPRWGVTIVEVGPLRSACHLDLYDPKTTVAQEVAEHLNHLRESGDDLFLGVSALGFGLPSRESSRVSITFEMPESADFDAIVRVAEREAKLLGAAPGKAYARGLWTNSVAARTSRLCFGREQIVEDGRV